MNDIALTGIPRGGTTLACRLLGTVTNTISLFEPMPVERLTPARALDDIQSYFARVRVQALREGTAPSKHVDGRIPDNPYGRRMGTDQARPFLVEQGMIQIDKPLTTDFRLVIKHNAAFTALLPDLASRLPVIGIIRNPLAVLASWRSVDLPVTHGRLPAGERLDPLLARRLDDEPDLLRRQIHLLDWFFSRLQRGVEPSQLVRYESLVDSQGACLFAAAGLDLTPDTDTAIKGSRNTSTDYDSRDIHLLADTLCRHGRESLSLYSTRDVIEVAAQLAERHRA